MSETTGVLPAASVQGRPGGRFGRPSAREAAWGFVFIGPWLIGLGLFTLGPMIASLVMSFSTMFCASTTPLQRPFLPATSTV